MNKPIKYIMAVLGCGLLMFSWAHPELMVRVVTGSAGFAITLVYAFITGYSAALKEAESQIYNMLQQVAKATLAEPGKADANYPSA